jgi:NAD(P)-dependent dehydrogenase (short-subunit alcohol dehydrogenase family)
VPRNSKPMAGMTALITGGSGALGSASAMEMARDGALVALMGRNQGTLDKAAQEIREDTPDAGVETIVGDAALESDLRRALRTAYEFAGRLDVIVALVGIAGGYRPLLSHTMESFREVLDFNVLSAFLAIRHGAPLMRKTGGSIVCISSNVAGIPYPAMAPYTASKMAIEGLVKCAADELANLNVRVNSVRPGLTNNDALEKLGPLDQLPAFKDYFTETPLSVVRRGFGEPDDIGRAVRWLAGPESAWVTGQSLAVDGGHELRRYPNMDEQMADAMGREALDRIRRGEVDDPV